MKTKYIPPIIMLAAGLIRAIAGVFYRQDIKDFLWSILIVMVIFYILGSIVKVVLDKSIIITSDEEASGDDVDIVLDAPETEDKEQENFEQEPTDGFDFIEKVNEDE